jgi:hypothetical protein
MHPLRAPYFFASFLKCARWIGGLVNRLLGPLAQAGKT